MIVYGLKTCDTCRKALRALVAAGVDHSYADVRADGVPPAVMQAAFAQFGDKLVNKSSATWRGLTDAEKSGDMLPLLLAHPTLMKRPLIVRDGQMTVGWKPDVAGVYL